MISEVFEIAYDKVSEHIVPLSRYLASVVRWYSISCRARDDERGDEYVQIITKLTPEKSSCYIQCVYMTATPPISGGVSNQPPKFNNCPQTIHVTISSPKKPSEG